MKNIILILFLVFATSCERERFNLNDRESYRWKRHLYKQTIEKLDGIPMINISTAFVKTEYVNLTSLQAKKQKDSIYKTSGGMFSYEYEKSVL